MESLSGNASISMEDSKSDLPLRRAESVINDQGSENARLQALDKGAPESTGHSRPERNQVLPQDGMDHPSILESTPSLDVPLLHWGDELNHEMKTLKMNDGMAHQEDQIVKKTDHCPISRACCIIAPLQTVSAKITWDTNLDQELEVALGCSVGITEDFT